MSAKIRGVCDAGGNPGVTFQPSEVSAAHHQYIEPTAWL
jgi:hypothetical protein